jgi:hypothetical protein
MPSDRLCQIRHIDPALARVTGHGGSLLRRTYVQQPKERVFSPAQKQAAPRQSRQTIVNLPKKRAIVHVFHDKVTRRHNKSYADTAFIPPCINLL